MALLDLSPWLEAAETLEEAAGGRRELRRARRGARQHLRPRPARAGSSASTTLALRSLQDHLTRSRDAAAAPSAARAEALTHAAGMAVMTSRFGDAMALAGEARAEASAAGADEISTRALIFMGMAESGRGGPGGLLHLARARREGERATGPAAAQRDAGDDPREPRAAGGRAPGRRGGLRARRPRRARAALGPGATTSWC